MLGGAFNPPHLGHLVCAQEALEQLELDRVLFVPVGEAPHRRIPQDPGPEVRLAMVERAVRDDDRFEASRVEVDRDGPSYTADTLVRLGGSPTLILGGDQAAALPSWHEPEEVLRLADVAVAERGDYERERIREALDGLEGGDRVRFLDMPRIEISSSLVRRRAAAGRPLRYLVPDAVAEYIRSERLYAGAPVGGGT